MIHHSELGWWEYTDRAPDPRLRRYVDGVYVGWTEYTSRVVRRREFPSGKVPLILNLGPAYRVAAAGDPAGAGTSHGSFVAGLHESYSIVEGASSSRALQVNLTPIGANLLFGLPMSVLANCVVELEDVLGVEARRLVDRMQDAPEWSGRFDLLDAFLLRRLADRDPASAPVAWALHRLEETGGRLDIGALAAEIGWSRKHLAARFREQVGLPPKTVARIVRFDRALRLLRERDVLRWTDVALSCGYFDQAHLIRDFAEFAGSPPGELVGRRLPDGGGILDA